MTLRPVESIRITIPPEGMAVDYELPPVCQVPKCRESWVHRHHIVRRTDTGGPQRWVSVDGLVLFNVMGICFRHHEQVTGIVGGHFAKIGFPSLEELAAGLYRADWLWYSRLPMPSCHLPQWSLLGPIDKPIYL